MPDPFRFPADFAARPSGISGTKVLDGRVYGFRFLPNARINGGRGGYFVDLFNALARPVVYGVRVILTDDLFAQFRSTVDVPPGRIVVRRTDGIADDPAVFDLTVPDQPRRLQTLGSPAVVVEYVTLAEIAAANGTPLTQG
jgi:hypothetical protein